jgi:hypothetical protein
MDAVNAGIFALVDSTKILSHRRRPVPMTEMDPGLRREDEDTGALH